MEENPLTAYDALFNNLKDKTNAILIGYKFDEGILSDILKNVENVVVVCPENVKQNIENCGITSNHIFTENDICGIIKTIHGKAYFLFNDYEIYCQIGSNNLTGSGMIHNIETYCSFEAHTDLKLTLEEIKLPRDKKYWKNFTGNKIINSILDVINSILSGRKSNDFLSETYLKKNLKEQCFVHTLGKNSLLTALKNILNEASKGSDVVIRFISPYSTDKSFEYFIGFVHAQLNKPFRFELLTNYLPDFKNYYESSESHFDPEYYMNLKKEVLKIYNVSINTKYWSKDGITEINIPGNFIHSKIIFINFKDVHSIFHYRMILTSANFSVPALGLDYERNLEFGVYDNDDDRVQEVWSFFNNFWEAAYNEEQCLKDISTDRKVLVEKEVMKEIPFRDYIIKNKIPSKFDTKSKTKGITCKLSEIRFLKLNMPDCEYLKDFLKQEISLKFYKSSPIIKNVQAEFLLRSIINDSIVSKTFKMLEDPSTLSYNLPLHDLKINFDEYIIDFIIISASTNILRNDIQVDTTNWQKLEKENIISFSGNKILLDFLEYKHSSNTNNIEIKFYFDNKYIKKNVTLENSDLAAIMPEKIPKNKITRILIRQIGSKYKLKRIGAYQPELWFSDGPIKFVEDKKESFDLEGCYEIPILWVNFTSEFRSFCYKDLTFYNEDRPIDILGYVDRSNKDRTILGFILDLKDEYKIIEARLDQHYKDLFKNLKYEINIRLKNTSKHTSILKQLINETFKNMHICIEPQELDDHSEVKMRYIQLNNKIDVETQISNEKYCRPKFYKVEKENGNVILGKYETGDIISCKLMKQIHNLTLFGPSASNKVKNRLIRKIYFCLPFRDHMRRFQYLGQLYTPNPMYLFSIKLMLESEISGFENQIENLYVNIDSRNYQFIKINSRNLKNEFYIFFKFRFFDSNSVKKKLKIIIETRESFTNFESETELNYEKFNNYIQINLADHLRKIENSEIIEEISEINRPLLSKVVKYDEQKDIRQQKLIITKEGYLEGSDNILPVWFR